MVTTDSEPRLELHVFAGSQGESIVLRLPNGDWGVIDCYASSLSDESTNATLRFLIDRGVGELEFLCLTHPHEDHYRGMSHLLAQFPVRCFWRPAVMHGERLTWILKYAKIDAHRSGWREAKQEAAELNAIFTAVRSQRDQRKRPLIPKNASLGTQLYPVPIESDAQLQIWAAAPSGRQSERYEEGLRKCFNEHGHLCQTIPHSHHNLVSMALLVVFGDTQLVLGGDVEHDGWQDVLAEFGDTRLAATVVKVSHHGSTNGYCEGAWDAFAAGNRPIAVVTPFRRHGLPESPALDHIREFASQLVTPCLPAVEHTASIPMSADAPVQSRMAIHSEFNAVSERTLPKVGRCSLIFDDQRNCLEQNLDPPAGEIR